MRVTDANGPAASYSVIRRSGEVVEVGQSQVLKLKLMPAGSGPLRKPAAWTSSDDERS